jgi:hypothetical protein
MSLIWFYSKQVYLLYIFSVINELQHDDRKQDILKVSLNSSYFSTTIPESEIYRTVTNTLQKPNLFGFINSLLWRVR